MSALFGKKTPYAGPPKPAPVPEEAPPPTKQFETRAQPSATVQRADEIAQVDNQVLGRGANKKAVRVLLGQ